MHLSAGSRQMLELRAGLLRKARNFFYEKEILEVETPALIHYPSLELHIDPFETFFSPLGALRSDVNQQKYYLHTSPEHAMKRLLVSGCGPIFYIGHVFRNGEVGRLHNPEYTMVEWYRPGFSFSQMMDEAGEFLETLLDLPNKATKRSTYSQVFEDILKIEPLSATVSSLQEKAISVGLSASDTFGDDKDFLLSWLFNERIEPVIGKDSPHMIYNFPSSQAALARIVQNGDGYPIAERFEIYFKGIELCNGYHELTDVDEQKIRFENENRLRIKNGKHALPVDEPFLLALKAGLPDCSGVAFGFDRIVMLSSGEDSIQKTLPFPFEKL